MAVRAKKKHKTKQTKGGRKQGTQEEEGEGSEHITVIYTDHT